jgi:hypothetical protein
MKIVTTRTLLLAGILASLASCAQPTAPDETSLAASSRLSAAKSKASRITSVVRNNDISGVELLEAWKVNAEDIADGGDAAQRSNYNRFKGMVDLWVNRKKAELTAASGSTLGGKVDLSAASLSPQLRQSYERLDSAPAEETGAFAEFPLARGAFTGSLLLAATAAQSIDKIIAKGKADQANLIVQQLESLRLQPWPAGGSTEAP